MRRIASLIVILLLPAALGAGIGAAGAAAATLSPIGSFEEPTFVTSDPSDPGRLFVVQRRGKIQLLEGGKATTFADLTSLVGCPTGCSGERGLMSIALAPDFSTSGHLYAFFAQEGTGVLHVDELTASGNSASLSTRRPILTIPHPDATNHNGGQLEFGPDGYLYVSTGDGGGSNDEFHNSQDPASLLGKILRVDPSQSEPQPTIWSLGLRNPFRFSFDRLTGEMVIADVGQSAREEIDVAPSPGPGLVGGAGANYGWNCREGLIEGPADDLPGEGCRTTPFVDPVFDYPHSNPGGGAAHGCAIIGGYVARDPGLGGLDGRYLYTDLCTGEIRSLRLPVSSARGAACGDRSEAMSVSEPVSFGEDSSGRIYVVSKAGEISRIEGATAEEACTPREEPAAGAGGQTPGGPGGKKRGRLRTRVRVTAEPRQVRTGGRVILTARVRPCAGRGGEVVQLRRAGRRLMSRRLDRRCRARFHPRLFEDARFRVFVPASGNYTSARSRKLEISVFGKNE